MSVAVDQSGVPGAMEIRLTRELADGALIDFSSAPVGWLAQSGEPRRVPYRAYHFTPADGKRTRVPSVTTLLDAIVPKPGLPVWAEARGIQGAVRAVQLGEITGDTRPDEAVERVRGLRLGADAARDEAADRGLDMHDLLEQYMRTGEPPSIGDHLPEHHGYVRAAANWLLKARPEPLEIEQLVCDPDAGFAGRSDLVAMIGGFRVRVDFKTSKDAAIYGGSHLQVGLYEQGGIACGDEPTDLQQIVVLAADGEFRTMLSLADRDAVARALEFYRVMKPLDSACMSANRAEKKARA